MTPTFFLTIFLTNFSLNKIRALAAGFPKTFSRISADPDSENFGVFRRVPNCPTEETLFKLSSKVGKFYGRTAR